MIKLFMLLIVLCLVSCEDDTSYSGYVIEKKYGYCDGNPRMDGAVMYCDNQRLDCWVTTGEFIKGEFTQHRHRYDAAICATIQINDYIP